jgi:hypothetical protein
MLRKGGASSAASQPRQRKHLQVWESPGFWASCEGRAALFPCSALFRCRSLPKTRRSCAAQQARLRPRSLAVVRSALPGAG